MTNPELFTIIIDPRGLDVSLTADTLDRIDALVSSGATINPDDNSYGTTTLSSTARRRWLCPVFVGMDQTPTVDSGRPGGSVTSILSTDRQGRSRRPGRRSRSPLTQTNP
jgi:hypothetical protein